MIKDEYVCVWRELSDGSFIAGCSRGIWTFNGAYRPPKEPNGDVCPDCYIPFVAIYLEKENINDKD